MNKPRDESSPQSPGSGEPASVDPPSDSKRSGRIAYDERGNSVWEWQLETGVYSRDITTQRLKKLDLNDLSIAETATHPRPPGLKDPMADPMARKSRERLPGGGFNPYDNSTTGGGNVASGSYNSGGRGTLKPDQGARPRKPVDLKKLQEWIELRKRVEQNKREDGDD